MTEIEEKSLKAQLSLLKEIRAIDNMIIYTVQSTAAAALKKLIEPKMFLKDKQEKVEFTFEEFAELKLELTKLASDDGFKELNAWIEKDYLMPKIEKAKILGMLQ
jgi:hypothetical protein